MSSEQTDGVPKKFMTKDPFSFKPTDTVWLKIDGGVEEVRTRLHREAIARERAELEAEKAARAAAEQAEARRLAEVARLAALAPDVVKLKAFAQRIRDVNETYPQVESEQARELVSLALHELEQVALALDAVGGGS